jgi:ABC-2 type transport system ATP-binding protein
MPSIVVQDVYKNFRLRHTHSMKETFLSAVRRRPIASEFQALDGVTFEVAEGESVALLGFNGSGKSTTLKMISGVLTPDQGKVLTRGRVAGLIEVGAGFHPDLSGRENIFLNAAILGMSKKETEERFDEIVAFSEIEQFIDTEVKHYSSGMFLRLAFSVAIHTEVDVLLIDEILSVGDEPFQKKCLARIRELHARGKTLVVVSHDLNMVARLCERGIVLKDGKVVFDGPSSVAVRELRKLSRSPFADVPREHEFFENIVRLADAQILPTTSDETGARLFHPEEGVTLGSMARAMHALSASSSTPNTASAPPGALGEDAAVEWLAADFAGGEPAWADSAAAPLTRATLATVLYSRVPSAVIESTPGAPFTDISESHPAFAAVSWLHAADISRGWADDLGVLEFRPDAVVTRESLVVFLSRFIEATERPAEVAVTSV